MINLQQYGKFLQILSTVCIPSRTWVTCPLKSWKLNGVRNPKDPMLKAITGGMLAC